MWNPQENIIWGSRCNARWGGSSVEGIKILRDGVDSPRWNDVSRELGSNPRCRISGGRIKDRDDISLRVSEIGEIAVEQGGGRKQSSLGAGRGIPCSFVVHEEKSVILVNGATDGR